MTFGIDISGFQSGMNLAQAKAEGCQFVIIKASGFNTGTFYRASGYVTLIDKAVAASLPKGHYYLIGGGQVWKSPTEQARYFVSTLYRFDVNHDVLMLDNEGLDSNGYVFSDAEAAEFMAEVIRSTGINPKRVWHYAGGADYRKRAPWPKIEALGIRYVWAAYGSAPTGKTPDHQPALMGSIPRWDVHQFTNRTAIAGMSVDGNYSPHSIANLFGGSVAYFSNRPAKGNMNQGFGPRPKPTPTSPAIHYGQDYGWGGGDAIFAARGGVVRDYGNVGAYGNRLIIDHGSGAQTWYCHLQSNVVPVGTVVPAGKQVAWMGATGNVTGKHLHFELRLNGTAVDPEPYFAASGPAGDGDIIIVPPEADVAKFVAFANHDNFRVRPQWQRFPWRNSPREENVAIGTGPGLFDVVLNLYLTEFPEDAQVEGRFIVENATTGLTTNDHIFTVNGHALGTVRAAIPMRFNVPPLSRVFLEMHKSSGAVDPLLDYWGCDIAVLRVG